MCTRSKAPWQRTMVLVAQPLPERSPARRRGRIFRAPDRSRVSAVSVAAARSPGRRVSSSRAPLERGAQHSSVRSTSTTFLQAERLALALLALDQVHRHFDVRSWCAAGS